MERNAYFDNAKLALIFLVVFGHMIQPFTDGSHGINTLYTWIYTFHMPTFIFLAGFFAKGFGDKKYITKLAKKLLFPYLMFQLLYTGFYFFIGNDDWQTGIFYPHWSLWFLFSLFCWHLLLYWFKKVPAVMSVTIAVLFGLIVGYFNEVGHSFSLSRTFVFFPFFLIGYWLKKDHVLFLTRKSVKVVSLIVMLAVATAIHVAPEFNTGWLLASKSYGDLGMLEFGGIARSLVYLTSALMAASILAWIPTKNNKLTMLGTRTMYVYLLHGFFVQFFRETNLFEINNVLDFLGLAVIAAIIVLVLSSKPILGVWQPFIEGKASILRSVFRQKENNKKQHNENLNT
ncbi:acyltransferase family protein [Virgibacillus ndiopensis]|uniref:acyltransferase family protein n=1 Tax=Virgibacillus ndiopensis TaxID=2004408 RepID=UPI000C083CFC|nr:acyltransferase family protein [Virgibacillus ndiopensis]